MFSIFKRKDTTQVKSDNYLSKLIELYSLEIHSIQFSVFLEEKISEEIEQLSIERQAERNMTCKCGVVHPLVAEFGKCGACFNDLNGNTPTGI